MRFHFFEGFTFFGGTAFVADFAGFDLGVGFATSMAIALLTIPPAGTEPIVNKLLDCAFYFVFLLFLFAEATLVVSWNC